MDDRFETRENLSANANTIPITLRATFRQLSSALKYMKEGGLTHGPSKTLDSSDSATPVKVVSEVFRDECDGVSALQSMSERRSFDYASASTEEDSIGLL